MNLPRWTSTYLPLSLIGVSLVALVLTPLVGERYARRHHQQLRGVAEPARGLITEVHLTLALGGDALYDFVSSGDSAALVRYYRSREREARAAEDLALLARQLDPDVHVAYLGMRETGRAWHEAVDEYLARGGASDVSRPPGLRTGEYAEALIAAARLDEAITRASQVRRQRILAAERVQMQLTVLLALVALFALVMLGLVGVRLRRAVGEADARRREVERMLEAKGRMVRGLSHDLKNPLNVIHGHASLIDDGLAGPVTDAQRKSLAHIRRGVRSLLGIIEDLLELWRAESGEIRVAHEPTNVSKVVTDTVEAYRAVAESSGMVLQAEVDPALPPLVTDANRVRQVLSNLVSNAVKYTPPGGCITVRAHETMRTPESANGRFVAIEVLDTGPGIPPDKTEAIFEEFTRLHPSSVPGAGLGLSISRGIARLLGGEVTVAHRDGGGAVFALWLPLTGDGAGHEPALRTPRVAEHTASN